MFGTVPVVAAPAKLKESLSLMQGRAGNRVVELLPLDIGNRQNPEPDTEVGRHCPVLPALGIGEVEMPIPPFGREIRVRSFIFREADLGLANQTRTPLHHGHFR